MTESIEIRHDDFWDRVDEAIEEMKDADCSTSAVAEQEVARCSCGTVFYDFECAARHECGEVSVAEREEEECA